MDTKITESGWSSYHWNSDAGRSWNSNEWNAQDVRAEAQRRPVSKSPVVQLCLSSDSKLVQEGYSRDGLAVLLEDMHHELYIAVEAILSDILPNAADDVTVVDDSTWHLHPEVGAAIQEAEAPELRYTLALCQSMRLWGVGLCRGWRDREAAASLALCVAIVLTSDRYEQLTQRYLVFRAFCDSNGLEPKARIFSLMKTPSTSTSVASSDVNADSQRREVCKHWMKGSCTWGHKCCFAHSKEPEAEVGNGKDHGDGQKWVWRRRDHRLWAHIILHKRHANFDLVPILIGRRGRNMRDIYETTWAKLRVRGRGSGHLELVGNKMAEAPVPLMVAVTTHHTDDRSFRTALELLFTRLEDTSAHYRQFCYERGLPQPTDHEPLFSFGEISNGAETIIQDLLLRYPQIGPIKKKTTPGGMAPLAGTYEWSDRIEPRNKLQTSHKQTDSQTKNQNKKSTTRNFQEPAESSRYGPMSSATAQATEWAWGPAAEAAWIDTYVRDHTTMMWSPWWPVTSDVWGLSTSTTPWSMLSHELQGSTSSGDNFKPQSTSSDMEPWSSRMNAAETMTDEIDEEAELGQEIQRAIEEFLKGDVPFTTSESTQRGSED